MPLFALIALSIGIGALVTVAVSWACWRIGTAGLVQEFQVARQLTKAKGECEGWLMVTHSTRSGVRQWTTWVEQYDGYSRTHGHPTTSQTPEEAVTGARRTAVLPWTTGSRPWPRLLSFAEQAQAASQLNSGGSLTNWETYSNSEALQVSATGWPLPALYGSYLWIDGPTHPAWTNVWDFDNAAPNATRRGNTLPGVPIGVFWDYFLLDSLLYGSLVFAIVSLPKLIRAGLRRKHGLCLTCAYDLRAAPPDTPCPECGTVPKQPTSTTLIT